MSRIYNDDYDYYDDDDETDPTHPPSGIHLPPCFAPLFGGRTFLPSLFCITSASSDDGPNRDRDLLLMRSETHKHMDKHNIHGNGNGNVKDRNTNDTPCHKSGLFIFTTGDRVGGDPSSNCSSSSSIDKHEFLCSSSANSTVPTPTTATTTTTSDDSTTDPAMNFHDDGDQDGDQDGVSDSSSVYFPLISVDAYATVEDAERDLDQALSDMASEMVAVRTRFERLRVVDERMNELKAELEALEEERLGVERENELMEIEVDAKADRVEQLRDIVRQVMARPPVSADGGDVPLNGDGGQGSGSESSNKPMSEAPTLISTLADDDENDVYISDDSSSLPSASLELYDVEDDETGVDETLSDVGNTPFMKSEEESLVDDGPEYMVKAADVEVKSEEDEDFMNVLTVRRNLDLYLLHTFNAALKKRGLDIAFLDDKKMWKPSKETEQFLKKMEKNKCINFAQSLGDEVLLWSGKPLDFNDNIRKNGTLSKTYGKDVPIVRARGILKVTPRDLVDMLWDSSRVKSYNSMSLGRYDELVFEGAEGGWLEGHSTTESKIVKSISKVPLVGKPMTLFNYMHVGRLDEGNGYVLVSRGADENVEAANKPSQGILFSMNLLRSIPGDEGKVWTEITTISHFNVVGIPMFIASSIGLKSASGFINQLREACEKN